MVADALHIGHITHVRKTRQLVEAKARTKNVTVVVGIHSDETVSSYKRKPLFNMEERMAHMVSNYFQIFSFKKKIDAPSDRALSIRF